MPGMGVGVREGERETRRMGTEAGNRNRTEPNLSVIEWGSKMYNKGWYNNKKFKMCKKHKKKIHLRQICGFHLNPCTLSPLLCGVLHPISDNNVGKNRCTSMSGLWVHPFRHGLTRSRCLLYVCGESATFKTLICACRCRCLSLFLCVCRGEGEGEVAEWVAEASRKSYLSWLESCNRSRTSIKSCMRRNKEAASRIMPPESGIHIHTGTDRLYSYRVSPGSPN